MITYEPRPERCACGGRIDQRTDECTHCDQPQSEHAWRQLGR